MERELKQLPFLLMPSMNRPSFNQRYWLMASLCMFGCNALAGESVPGAALRPAISIGQRTDQFGWNIAGPAVNVLSELSWKDLQSRSVTAELSYIHSTWQIRGQAGYAQIINGTNQDSDYNGNNRTLENYRSNNKGGGTLVDGSIGLGKTILQGAWAGHNYRFTPYLGYAQHQQRLTMYDGQQTLPASASGPIYGLQNSYNATWNGPWVGAEFEVNRASYNFISALQLHSVAYSAEADWNLRTEFSHPVSFRHSAHGHGVSFSLGISHPLWKSVSANMVFNAQYWRTRSGTDQTLYAAGNVDYYPLNEVGWRSNSLNIGIAGEIF